MIQYARLGKWFEKTQYLSLPLRTRIHEKVQNLGGTVVAALILGILGILIIIVGFALTHPASLTIGATFPAVSAKLDWVTSFVEDMYSNGGIELISIAVTVLIIESLNRRRADRERREELILQMGSPINSSAVEAARILSLKKWLRDGSLENRNFQEADLRGADLTKARLQGVKLGKAQLRGAQLRGAQLQGADLPEALLEEVNLREANLEKAQLWQANLQGAQMMEADCQHTFLAGANLAEADLREVNFHRARLTLADLSGARLMEANLNHADLASAKLRRAQLIGADLTGARLSDADLSGADLTGALFDDYTTLPDGTTWSEDVDLERFTNPRHPAFWRSDNRQSPAYRSKKEAEIETREAVSVSVTMEKLMLRIEEMERRHAADLANMRRQLEMLRAKQNGKQRSARRTH